MKKTFFAFMLLLTGSFFADDTVKQTINMSISAISSINVSPSSVSMTLSQSISGDITPASQSCTWEYVDNQEDNMVVKAAIDSDMPTDTTLCAYMTAPSGATSAGAVSLTSTAQNLVMGIAQGAQTNIPLELTFDAEATASTGSFSRTIIYTLTTGS